MTDEEVSPVGGSVADSESILIDENLPGSLTAAREARGKLALVRPKLEPGRFEELRILVNELVTNSLRHAGALQSGWIGLKVRASAGVVRVEVSDQGPGFEPPLASPALDQTSGRGLFLVDALCDRWGVVTSDRTTVWAEIDLS